MKRIGVIGCNSFLAKHLIKSFADDELYLYGRSYNAATVNSGKVVYAEFNYPEVPLDFNSFLNFDIIIYTAAAGVQAGRNESNLLVYGVNFFLPMELVNFLNQHEYKGKLITFGSYFEIGNNNEIRPFNEAEVVYSTGYIPNSYCGSKRLLSRFYSNQQFDICWIHLMVPSLYGPGEDDQRLIPYVINGLKIKSALKLSSGEQIRHYLFVSDLVDLIAVIIETAIPADIYNVAGPDQPIKIKDLVAMICQIMGAMKPHHDQIGTRDQKMAYLSLDTDKIKRVIRQWSPNVCLMEGLKKYLSNSIVDKIKYIERKKIEDSRGWFLKVIDGNEYHLPNYTGEVYLTCAIPGEAKGGHYHKKANEWFTLIQGDCELKLVDLITGEKLSVPLSSKMPVTLYVPNHIAHVFINRSLENFTLLAYSDQLYAPGDTIIFHDF